MAIFGKKGKNGEKEMSFLAASRGIKMAHYPVDFGNSSLYDYSIYI